MNFNTTFIIKNKFKYNSTQKLNLMKKQIFFLVLSLLCNTYIFGQQKEEAEKLVGEGVALHDKGNYQGAIVKYDKALQLDSNNLYALAEKAMTLFFLEKFNDAIQACQTAIAKHPGDKELKTVYVTCGNAYDGLKKPDKAIEMYDEGIKLSPDFYQLHFNKGITLSGLGKNDEAILCFQKSASLNPKHASSQNALGRLLKLKGKRIPSLMAFSRFLILEPESDRAKENLVSLQQLIKGNAQQTGKKSITININPDMLGDTTADGKTKENCFSTTDLILSLDAALDYDKKNKNKSEVEQFIRKFETVCSSFKETKKDNYGFYWEYYAPYFIQMKEKNLCETFAYIAFASSDDPKVTKWIESHKSEITGFYEWSGNYAWITK